MTTVDRSILELFEDLQFSDEDIRPKLKFLLNNKFSYQELEFHLDTKGNLLRKNLELARLHKALADTALFAGEKDKSKKFIVKALNFVKEEVKLSVNQLESLSLSDSLTSLQRTQVNLPVRIDLAGGWTDTPPYSLEKGGKVLNLAILLDGRAPISAQIRPVS